MDINDASVRDLFKYLDDMGGGEFIHTTQDDEGNIATVLVVARGNNAEEIVDALDDLAEGGSGVPILS